MRGQQTFSAKALSQPHHTPRCNADCHRAVPLPRNLRQQIDRQCFERQRHDRRNSHIHARIQPDLLRKVEMLPAVAVDEESEAVVLPEWRFAAAGSVAAGTTDDTSRTAPRPTGRCAQDWYHDRDAIPGYAYPAAYPSSQSGHRSSAVSAIFVAVVYAIILAGKDPMLARLMTRGARKRWPHGTP
jgi:hypothetical protein